MTAPATDAANQTQETSQTQRTPDVLATPDATVQDTQPTAGTQQGASSADVLTQSEWTRRAVAMCAMVTVSLCVLAAVVVMAYRVAIDGNTPLTADISGKLTLIAITGFGAMVAALFGSNSIIGKLIEKLMP